MNAVVAILLWGLFALIVGQGLLTLGFVAALQRWKRPLITDEAAPKAAVVLCLRGPDPFLGRCLRSLLSQDYPNYDVQIIIDHPDDPAGRILQPLLAEYPAHNVQVHVLEQRLSTCSLKCSSLVQAVRSLGDSYGFVAQLDADTIPHPSWLRELATALADDRVGAATGNRWYMPQRSSLGALVRYLWNAAAVVQMYWYGIAWGGTLAVPMRVLRETDVVERWSRAFCEDTMLLAVLRQAGLRVSFVPSLMMVNREDCGLDGFFSWVRRQMLTARLYHPAWLAVVSHGLATTTMLLLAVGLAVWGWLAGDAASANWALAGFVGYQVCIMPMLALLEATVRQIVRARGEHTRWMTWSTVVLLPPALLLTQLIHAAALASACVLRRVDWRGVEYEIDGPARIRLVEYRPFAAESSSPSEVSL